jgi:signal transduction histidine kinase
MPASSRDLNLKIIASLLHYVREKRGAEAVGHVLAPAGVEADGGEVEGWVSHEQFEAVLERARGMLESDQEFTRACAHEAIPRYGPMILVFRAGTVRSALSGMVRTTSLVSGISRYAIEDLPEPNAARISYQSQKNESRLMCLSRQAQLRLIPTLWPGLPEATLVEESCIARGDASCTYLVRWAETLRTRWAALGGILGASMALGVQQLQLGGGPFLALLPIACGAIGLAISYAEKARTTSNYQTQTVRMIEALIDDHERALIELRSLSAREQTYTDLLEERVKGRTTQLEEVVEKVVGLQERQSISLRGLSHDMRSPLQVLTFLSFRLRSNEGLDPQSVAVEIDESVRRMRDQLGQLASVASNQPDAFALRAMPIPLEPLAGRIKRHLDALLLGRGVTATCFRTREAPDAITSDPTLFDRIVDNIVTNAAKYTDRGSIVVEISGTPGTLSIKVSDTGRGMSPDRLEHVFTGTERDENPNVGDSLGIGLANTVQLLDQIGGRLEVMSRPSMGTTVWIHLPVERSAEVPQSTRSVRAPASTAMKDVVARVVRIRAAP